MSTQANLSEKRLTGIEVREFYNGYSPPRYVLGLVVRLLVSIPAKYTNGLDAVVLTNQSGAPRRERLGKVTSRKHRVTQADVCGRYHAERQGKAAWIEIYVDKIASALRYAPPVPFGRTLCFGKVLFHEVGHHIHTTVKPEFREKEDVADDWGKKLTRNYLVEHYWYVPKPAWKVIGWILKAIAAEL